MKRRPIISAMALALVSCGPDAEQPNSQDEAPPAAAARPAPHEAPAAQPRTSLPEPTAAIDPRSVEAAGQIVQSYGALIEQKRWSDANGLWGTASAAAQFQASLPRHGDIHLEIGNLGEPEGAAGSIYVTMPVILYGDDDSGQPFRRSAIVTLRRVNDVPGSTEAERRWHIERID